MTPTSLTSAKAGNRPARSNTAKADQRISVSLTGRAAETTRQLGDLLELTDGEVIRRALSLLAAVVAEEEVGSTLAFRTASGEVERIRWRTAL